MGKKIVVVGAGYAGLLATKKLAKRFKKDKDIEITIIDKNPFSTMLTELHEVAAGRVEESSIRMDLQKIFAGRPVEVKLDTVEKVDFDQKVVIGKHDSYEYDYIVMASGSKPAYFGIIGIEKYTHTLWSYEDAIKLHEHIVSTFMAASREPDRKKRQHLLTFYVIGAGLTGVEMMGELAEYVPILCQQYAIDREDVKLVLVDAVSGAVPTIPQKLGKKIERRLTKMGVELRFNAKVNRVSADSIALLIDGNEKEANFDVHTIIWTAGIESSDLSKASGESLSAAQRAGRIETDQYLRALGHDDVYVVGDNIHYVLEGQERPLPQMVENAEQSGKLVAKNIAAAIEGKQELTPYKPAFHGTMVCIGGRWGTANIQFGKVKFNLWSFFAMFAKHLMNCVYFVQILGWNKVFSYLRHEIFTIRNRRSFVGGNFSNRTPSFLMVPLRVWLGAVWVFEAVMKYFEGWLDYSKGPKLEGFFTGADGFYQSILGGGDAASGATGAADAASGATGAGSGAASTMGEALLNIRFFNVFHIILISAVPISASLGLSDIAFKLNIPLMNWFVQNIILSGDGIQFFMQTFIVVLEFLIGLGLIGGLFTTASAIVSIVLQFMFLTTTGWYLVNVWMFFAGIAAIFSGRIFGLDYWFMPWFKEKWKNLPFIKKWYLYND